MDLSRGIITAVLGDIVPQDLGFCQSHEHLFIKPGCSGEINPALCIDDLDKSLAELEAYYRTGGRALVDAQPPFCGRDPAVLAELSKRSGVHIIASTGFHRTRYYSKDHRLLKADADVLTRFYLAELNEGMYSEGNHTGQSSSRAGQIKTALEAGTFDRLGEKLFSAAAAAAGESGCAVMIHVEKNADPAALADFLMKRGAAPSRLIFCHLDRAVGDLGIHREIARRGAYLEYDTIGRPKYHDDKRESAIILEMTEAGFAGQLLLSLDTTRARLAAYGGSPGLSYILTNFIPLLKGRGITEEQIRMFFVKNPAKAFARSV
jgi:phosphotriesterase-related protein